MNCIFSLDDIELRRSEDFILRVNRLNLAAGESYALVGPNGSGKSTLLSLLAMLLWPDSGKLYFAGREVSRKISGLKAVRRQVTLMEQSPYLFDLSVGQNVVYGLQLRGIRGSAQRARIAEALNDVGLAGFENRRARDLSGGELRRVAMARALALHPEVLLLDEPTANIDTESLQAFESLLPTLPERGITVVFSTHDPGQPGRLGATMIEIENGRLKRIPVLVPATNAGGTLCA